MASNETKIDKAIKKETKDKKDSSSIKKSNKDEQKKKSQNEENASSEKRQRILFHKKIIREFRKIDWASWKTTRKSFWITLAVIIVASLFFFGISIGIIELLEVMGAV